ncbi:MAG TPA: hypothetical protein VMS17_18155 [Gemmataceae bacterium]|nr:hypothetical protein [Gemmataceae bacterium]
MRVGAGLFLALVWAAGLWAADGAPSTRYGLEVDLKMYPQSTPKECLGSVLKAAESGRSDYLAAQLADPQFIDDRVKMLFGGDFRELVKDVQARLDPAAVKQLHRFFSDGEWTADADAASVHLKDDDDRAVFFRKIDGRWYMENRTKTKQ